MSLPLYGEQKKQTTSSPTVRSTGGLPVFNAPSVPIQPKTTYNPQYSLADNPDGSVQNLPKTINLDNSPKTIEPVVPPKANTPERVIKSAIINMFSPVFGPVLNAIQKTDKYQSTKQTFDEKIKQPVLDATINRPFPQQIIKTVSDSTRGSRILATGESFVKNLTNTLTGKPQEDIFDIYQNQLNNIDKKIQDPSNNFGENVLYGIGDSGPQTLVGVGLGLVPFAGPALSGSYFSALSAQEQIDKTGKVTSPTKIAIDTIGDRMLGGVVEGLLKKGKTELVKTGFKELAKNIGKGATTEGSTEVAQSILKYATDYQNAKSPAERNAVAADAKDYVKSGGMFLEFLVGGVIGGGVASVAGTYTPEQSNIIPNKQTVKSLAKKDDKDFNTEQNTARENIRKVITTQLDQGARPAEVANGLSKSTGVPQDVALDLVNQVNPNPTPQPSNIISQAVEEATQAVKMATEEAQQPAAPVDTKSIEESLNKTLGIQEEMATKLTELEQTIKDQRESGFSDFEIAQKLQKQYKMSLKEANDEIAKYVKNTDIKPESTKIREEEANKDEISNKVAIEEAQKYQNGEDFYQKGNRKIIDSLNLRGKEQIVNWFDENITPKEEILDNLNPTGTVFTEYTPAKRAKMKLGENITTLNETSNKPADTIVTIYRGAPKSQKTINPGDFVTTNYDLAKSYGENVIKADVKMSDILDDKKESLGEEYLYRPKEMPPIASSKEDEKTVINKDENNASNEPAVLEEDKGTRETPKYSRKTLLNMDIRVTPEEARKVVMAGIEKEGYTEKDLIMTFTNDLIDGDARGVFYKNQYLQNIIKLYEKDGKVGLIDALHESKHFLFQNLSSELQKEALEKAKKEIGPLSKTVIEMIYKPEGIYAGETRESAILEEYIVDKWAKTEATEEHGYKKSIYGEIFTALDNILKTIVTTYHKAVNLIAAKSVEDQKIPEFEKEVSSKKMITAEEGKARLEEYKDRLKLDFDVDFADVIFTGETNEDGTPVQAYAVTYNNKITLIDNIHDTTADHEFVHIVMNNIEKIKAFEGITAEDLLLAANDGEAYGKADFERLNEKIAIGFQDYVDGKDQAGVPGILTRFYEKLKLLLTDLFKALGGNVDIIQDFYRRLSFAKAKAGEEVKLESSKEADKKAQFEKEGVKGLDFTFETVSEMQDIRRKHFEKIVKNPKFDTGDKLTDARLTLEYAEKRENLQPAVIRKVNVSGKDIVLPDKLQNDTVALEIEGEYIEQNPLNDLWKYADKRNDTLPEVTGKDTSIFAQKGDDIVNNGDFIQFADSDGNVDSETVRDAFRGFVDEKRSYQERLKTHKTKVNEFKKEAKDELALEKINLHEDKKNITDIKAREKEAEIERRRKLFDQAIANAKAEQEQKQSRIRIVNEAKTERVKELGFWKRMVGQSLNPLNYTDKITQNIFNGWNQKILQGSVRADKEAKAFVNIPVKDGLDTILKYEAGEETKYSKEIKDKFDALRTEAQDRGVDLGFRENYLPHVYAENSKEIDEKIRKYLTDKGLTDQQITAYENGEKLPESITKSLKINPFFSKERVFPTYRVAMEYGLTPRYTNVAQLVGHYVEELETIVANNELVTELEKAGKILPFEDAPVLSWDMVNLPFSKKGYMAPPNVAKVINGLFGKQEPTFWTYMSKLSKKMQEIKLSAGLPYTTVNFFAIGQLVKEITAGNFKATNAFFRANFNRKSMDWFEENRNYVYMMAKQGINLRETVDSWENLYSNISDIKGIGNKSGEIFDRAFNKKTFMSFMPMMQVQLFKDTYNAFIKKGYSPDIAEEFAGRVISNNFGLSKFTGRSRKIQDKLSAIFFAPTFREGIINTLFNTGKAGVDIAKNLGGLRSPLDPTLIKNRKLLAGMILTYLLYNLLNRRLDDDGDDKNGKENIWDNPKNRKFALQIPTDDGTLVYVEFMPSFLAFARNMISGGLALPQGDFATAKQKFGSVLSMPIQVSTQIWANKDYFDRPIYKETDTGSQKALKIAKYLGLSVNHPYIQETVNQLQDKKPLYQSLVIGLELPLKFSTKDAVATGEYYDALAKKEKENAQAKSKVQPIYDKVQELKNQNKFEEATKLVDSLSEDDQIIYNKITDNPYEKKKAKNNLYEDALVSLNSKSLGAVQKELAVSLYGEKPTKAQQTTVNKDFGYYQEFNGYKYKTEADEFKALNNDNKVLYLKSLKNKLSEADYNEFILKGRKKVRLSSGASSPILIPDDVLKQTR